MNFKKRPKPRMVINMTPRGLHLLRHSLAEVENYFEDLIKDLREYDKNYGTKVRAYVLIGELLEALK